MVEDLHSQADLTLAHLAVLYERLALFAQEHELELAKIARVRPIIVERGLKDQAVGARHSRQKRPWQLKKVAGHESEIVS